MVMESFTTAVPVKQSAKVDSDCVVLCLCWTMRRPGGLVSSLARGRRGTFCTSPRHTCV